VQLSARKAAERRPCVAGSSQAIAVTSAICSGGKTARATRPRSILKPLEALGVEAPPPATDHLLVHIKAPRDLPVGVTLGGVEHQPGPLNLPERQR
jgi:hypothetical protein